MKRTSVHAVPDKQMPLPQSTTGGDLLRQGATHLQSWRGTPRPGVCQCCIPCVCDGVAAVSAHWPTAVHVQRTRAPRDMARTSSRAGRSLRSHSRNLSEAEPPMSRKSKQAAPSSARTGCIQPGASCHARTQAATPGKHGKVWCTRTLRGRRVPQRGFERQKGREGGSGGTTFSIRPNAMSPCRTSCRAMGSEREASREVHACLLRKEGARKYPLEYHGTR